MIIPTKNLFLLWSCQASIHVVKRLKTCLAQILSASESRSESAVSPGQVLARRVCPGMQLNNADEVSARDSGRRRAGEAALACLRLSIGLSPALYWLVSGSLLACLRLFDAAPVPRCCCPETVGTAWAWGAVESRQQPSSGAHCQSRSSPLRVRRRKGDTTPRGTGAPHSKWSPRRTEAAAPRPTRDMQAVGAPQSARPRMSSNPHSPAPHE